MRSLPGTLWRARFSVIPPRSRPSRPRLLSLVPSAARSVPARSQLVIFRHVADPSNSKKRSITARDAAGHFSPNRPIQGLTHRSYSPRLTEVLVAAAVVAPFDQAVRLVHQILGVRISARHLQNLASEVGTELARKRDERTSKFRDLPLNTPRRQAEPPIPLACVMVDGGRMRTRAACSSPGVHDPRWRETKTAVLLRMTDVGTGEDPHPELPHCFATPMTARDKTTDEPSTTSTESSPKPKPPSGPRPRWSPEPILKTGVASLADSDTFGWMVAAEAEQRGFHAATKGAFVADGQSYNWAIQRRHFPKHTPILDFMHAAEHLYEAASALNDTSLGRTWTEACWQGNVEAVIAELRQRLDNVERPPEPAESPGHVWCVLDRTIGYLESNLSRMRYPEYRQAGLPLTSSPVESWIKQLNQRVKGSEKFWEDGRRGEAILQLRTAWQSEDESLDKHLRDRAGHPWSKPPKPKSLAA